MTKNKIDLSIVILNYNSGLYLSHCLESIYKSDLKNYQIEVIIVDNASSDDSINQTKLISPKQKIKTDYLLLSTNSGFAAGNNRGVGVTNSDSKYLLFLNPDTIVNKNTLSCMIEFFDNNSSVDAATCKIILALTGKTQPECHRGFPTPWRSFCYFSGLTKFFSKSKLFSGYFLGHLNLKKVHPIEACVGAFLMVKREVGNSLGWWNERYFFYGEDLDFCYKLKQADYKLFFNPCCQITHFQGVSSGIITKSQKISQASRNTKIQSALASTNAMRIFYQENLFKNYPFPLRWLIMMGIKLLETQRLFKAKYL